MVIAFLGKSSKDLVTGHNGSSDTSWAVMQFEFTPKALANWYPWLEAQRQPWEQSDRQLLKTLKGFATNEPFQGSIDFLYSYPELSLPLQTLG